MGSLDPARADDPSSLTVLKAACDGITALDPASGKPQPALARSWSFESGARRLTVHLGRGRSFDDGTAVSAQSVRESLSRVARPATASPWAGLVSNIAGFPEVQSGAATHLGGVKALSSSKLEIDLVRPFSDFPTVLGHPGLTPVSLKSLENSPLGPELPVCSGPYRIEKTEGEREHRLRLRSEAGSGRAPASGKPMADVIVVESFDNSDDAYAALESGDVDLAPVPEAAIGEAHTRRGFERQVGAQVALLVFHAGEPPTDDVRLRRAISLALDRLVIIDAAFPDRRSPALRWLPETFSEEAGAACAESIRKVADSAKAKEQLTDASPGKEPIPLIFDPGRSGRLVPQAIQIQVKDVLGIQLDPEAMDGPEFEASLKAKDGPAIWLTSTDAQLPIPDELVGALFSSGSDKNRTGFANPEVDAAIEEARKASRESEAARLWAEAENKVCEHMPAIPLWRSSGQWTRNPDKVSLQGDSMLDLSGNPVLRQLHAST